MMVDEDIRAEAAAANAAPRRQAGAPMALRLTSVAYAAEGTNLYEFRHPDGADLPPFSAGAHIDVMLPNGLLRQYSLVNAQGERHRYVVAVKLDRMSRGGSRAMHEDTRVGATYTIGGPRNTFALVEDAPHVVLIAGGIGVTPIWCMVQRLAALGRPWTLYYACRTRAEAAFLDALEGFESNVRLHFDDEAGGVLDVAAIVAAAPRDAHLYCCGPAPMLAAFESATADLAPGRVHVEYFTPKEERATEGGFVIELAKSGVELEVPPGKTILQVIREAGIEVESCCEEGFCFTCETKVIAGIPDHRDSVLSAEERAANNVMLICCSGALSDRLVLDR